MSGFHQLRIARHKTIAEDAVEVAFEVPENLASEFTALPGQHLVVRAHLNGREYRRTYSLTSSTDDQLLRICLRVHKQGVMSRHIAERLFIGDAIEALSPKGSFFSAAAPGQARHCVAFAGGCGITPIFSLLSSLLRDEPGSHFTLCYGNRTRERSMLLDALFDLKDRYKDRFAMHLVMSREETDTALFNGRMDRDWVRRTGNRLFRLESQAFYICGPGSMIGDVRDTLLELDVAAERIHVEHFTRDTLPATQSETLARQESKQGQVDVTILQSGRRRGFSMHTEQTILEAGLAAGFDLPYACMGGVCATCRTRLVKGRVEMQENYALESQEVDAGVILACQAMPLTDKVTISYDDA